MLLHHYSWDKTAVLDAIARDEKETFQQVGLQDPRESSVCTNTRSTNGVSMSCDICYSDMPADTSVKNGPACGHPFCSSCWIQYLTTQITVNSKTIGLECPMTNCKSLVEEQFIGEILSEFPPVLSKYKSLLCTSFVYKNVNTR